MQQREFNHKFRGYYKNENAPQVTLKDVKLIRIIELFKNYWLLFSLILVLSLSGSVLNLAPPLVMKEIIDKAIPGGHKRELVLLVCAMVGLPLVGGVLSLIQNQLNNRVGQGVMRDLRRSLYRNLQRQSISFFTRTRAGEVVQRLTGDVSAVQSIITTLIITTVTQIITILTTLTILFALDWKLALLSLVTLPILIYPVRTVSRLRKRLRLEAQKVRGDMSAQLGEVFGVSGALLTRIFTREELQEQQFTEMNEKVMDLELRSNMVGRWFKLLVSLLAPIGAGMVYLVGGFGAIEGRMTVGAIVAFAAYLGRLYNPLDNLLNLHVEFISSLGIFYRIFEYRDLKPDIENVPGAIELPDLTGKVEFKNVFFTYGDDQSGLKGIAFTVEPGQVLALVGPSGAGKTTLVGLISRLYDPTSGCIEMDGHDIRGVTLESLRKQVAVVIQDPFLFHASIRENLLFARDDVTQEELEEACKRAYIHDFIAELPEGYETFVGERGHRLSGGQRQRLAIARAILKDPRVLILDEATSHLDAESEAHVQKALESLMHDRTTIVIAHRLATVLSADQILVLEDGAIVEQGSHAQLLQKQGLYAKLFHTQFADSGHHDFAQTK